MKAMNNLKYAGLAALVSSVAFATNITISDPFTDSTGFFSPYSNNPGVPEAGWVENGATAHNSWDLASFTLSGNMLSMNGGFDFRTGKGSGHNGVFAIGDIFVYTSTPYAGVSPYANKDNWTYVIHFERTIAGGNPNITGGSINYQIISNAAKTGYLYTQNPDALITNLPWMVGNGSGAWTVGSYSFSGTSLSTTFQNSLTVNVGSLLSTPGDLYFSATMRCGNDILWGHTVGRVPDGGFTLVLLSLGLGGLALAVRRRK